MAYDGTIKIDTSIDSSGVKKGVSGITSSIKSIAGALGIVKVVGSAFTMLKSSIQSAFDRSDTMEQFDRTMTAITGDSKAAGVALEELKGITKGTAYGLDIAAKATQNFVTRGLDIGDATKRVGIWADAVSFYGKGTNEELQTVTDALAKMSTKGKVEMEQLDRLFDVGIDAVGMYAKATGRSSAQVQDDLSYGRISAEEFISVVSSAMETGAGGVQKVAGAAKEAGTSWKGTMDNMKAACTRGMLGIIESIDDGLKSINLPTIRQSIAGFGSFMETTLGKVGNVIKGLIQEFGPSIANVVQTFKSAFSKIPIAFKPIVKTVKEFIQDILKSFTSGGLKTAIYTLSNIISSLGNIINKVAKVVLPILSKAINTIGKNLQVLVPLLVAAVVAFKGWSIVQKVKSYMKALTTTISAVNAATKATIVSTLSSTAATTKEAAANTAATAAIGIKQLALGVLTGKIGIATAAQWLWNTAMAANPIGLVITAVAVLIAGITSLSMITGVMGSTITSTFENAGKAAADFYSGIETSKSHLSDFNDTLFISSQKQQELTTNMENIQNGITEICRRASDERRDYTAEEVAQLDTYFEKLRGLYTQQLEVEKLRTQAIQQQAVTQAETFHGSLEEYKVMAQGWINTAQQQAEQETSLIQEQTTTQIALLNARYGEQANMSNEAYANEYNTIMANQQSQLDAVQQGIGNITAAYTNGYAQRSGLAELEKQRVGADNASIESENQRHADRIAAIEHDSGLTSTQQQQSIAAENKRHESNMLSIWNEITKGMSEEQQDQLGVYLGLLAQTELYGGELDTETAGTAKAIVENFESMPKGTRQAMDDAMSPMLDEMEKAKPGLFAKAMDIGNGIISTLKRAFDEHSPSKKTKKIAYYLWEGFEIGTEKYEPVLYKKTKSIGQNIIDKLHGILDTPKNNSIIPLGASVDLSGINPSAIVSKMQAAVAASQARIMTNVSATAYTNMISKLDSLNFVKEIKSACKEGCESASLQAEVTGKVVMGQRQVGTLVAPYVSEELGKGDVYD